MAKKTKLQEIQEKLEATQKQNQELQDALTESRKQVYAANMAVESLPAAMASNRPSQGTENIILQGENQNMSVEELHNLLVADFGPIEELRKEHGDEKAAEIISERREECRKAIRRMLVSVQASTIKLNEISDAGDERVKKALQEYDKKYKPKVREEVRIKAEAKSKSEKLIEELIKKHGFSQEEAEEMVLRRQK